MNLKEKHKIALNFITSYFEETSPGSNQRAEISSLVTRWSMKDGQIIKERYVAHIVSCDRAQYKVFAITQRKSKVNELRLNVWKQK